jgi:hypothetical protein
MRTIFPIIPSARTAYWNGDTANYTGLVPNVNAWDDTAGNRLGFTIHVPVGERWLTHFDLEGFIQGPNVPTYQCGFGVVLKGATRFEPATIGSPGSYWLGVAAQNDAAWGACSIPLWLNPGLTVANFAIRRDAGAVTIARRQIRASPYLGMKI